MLCDVRSAQSGGIIDFQQRSFDLQEEEKGQQQQGDGGGGGGGRRLGRSWVVLGRTQVSTSDLHIRLCITYVRCTINTHNGICFMYIPCTST